MTERDAFAKPMSKLSRGDPATKEPRVPSGVGINAVHVNSAREMVKLHTRGRAPIAAGSVSATPRPKAVMGGSGSMGPSASGYPKSGPHISVPAKGHTGDCHNPQCTHCGQVIIPSPAASFPFHDQPSITVHDWSIYTVKKPILNSPELDHLAETRFDFPLPEMIFGNNAVRLVNDKSGEVIEFNALDALDSIDDDCLLKVSYHSEWLSARRSKKEETKEQSRSADKQKDIGKFTDNLDVMKPYDWTYSTNYKGTTSEQLEFETTSEQIPIDKLLKPDPILFYDESILFEDELGDNGISMLSTRIRVMPQVLLLLCRFFLRIDNVIFRIRDTRVFIDFATNQVLREYKVHEFAYDELLKKSEGKTNDPKSLLRDPQWVSQNIPVISSIVEVNKASRPQAEVSNST